jgi:hypothetical protein
VEKPEMSNEFALEELEKSKELASTPPVIIWESVSEGPVWGFSIKEEYIWDARDREPGEIPETLTQQYLRVDVTDDPWKGAGYVTWKLDTKPPSGVRLGTTWGFGSWETSYQPDTTGDKLREPSTKRPSDMGPLKLEWKGKGKIEIKALKRS